MLTTIPLILWLHIVKFRDCTFLEDLFWCSCTNAQSPFAWMGVGLACLLTKHRWDLCKMCYRDSMAFIEDAAWGLNFLAACRLVTVGGDDSLALVEQGAARWVREEALGSVTGSLFLDLPAPSPELASQWRAAAPTLSERIQAEFLSIKVHPGQSLCRRHTNCHLCGRDSAPLFEPYSHVGFQVSFCKGRQSKAMLSFRSQRILVA